MRIIVDAAKRLGITGEMLFNECTELYGPVMYKRYMRSGKTKADDLMVSWCVDVMLRPVPSSAGLRGGTNDPQASV